MSEIPAHLRPLFQKLLGLPTSAPPSPWHEAGVHAVGGLTDVAFAESSDLLLVVSSSGRGLFDCSSGQRIARDDSDDFQHDTSNLVVAGIGPLASQRLHTAGVHGGGLAVTTADGWSLDLLCLSWPRQSLFLTPPGHWLYRTAQGGSDGSDDTTSKIATDSEIRAFGFSPTGRAFIFATGSDISVFNRAASRWS